MDGCPGLKKILYTRWSGTYILTLKEKGFQGMVMVKQKIPIVLTMVLTFMAYGLTFGLHLKFCFGEDGHWDIAPIVCKSDQQASVPKSSKANPPDHHGECHDVSTACNESGFCTFSPLLLNQKISQKVLHLASVSEASGKVKVPADKSSVFPSSSEPSFFRSFYLRTVVLLI